MSSLGSFGNGIAVGMGIGFLNATFFSLPGWMNIIAMCAIGLVASLSGGNK